MRLSWHIATVFGVPIRLHVSVLLLFFFIGSRLGNPLAGLALTVLLLFSLVLHELGHTYVALRGGMRVREIDMMFFGGMAVMQSEPASDRLELRMAAAGPLVSLLLALSAFAFLWLAGLPRPDASAPLNPLQMALLWMVAINLMLALFNLIPAFPLDGGRILRALLARRIGRLPATFAATRIGKILAVLLGIAGLYRGHWMLIVIAIVVYVNANREYRLMRLQHMMGGAFRPPGADGGPAAGDPRIVVGPPPYERPPRPPRTGGNWFSRFRP